MLSPTSPVRARRGFVAVYVQSNCPKLITINYGFINLIIYQSYLPFQLLQKQDTTSNVFMLYIVNVNVTLLNIMPKLYITQ